MVETASEPQEAEPRNTVTLSVRLTEDQRDLLTKAAELRGWSPTNLLRTAALERATHIVNTSSLTRLNFRGLAMEIAVHLFAKRTASTLNADGEKTEMWVVDDLANAMSGPSDEGDPPPAEVAPKAMSLAQLNELTRAARVGGSEFLSMIVEACSSTTAPNRRDLPEPIDPSAV